MSSPVRIALRSALWILLGGWIGGLALFAAVVAPAAFGELPRELAGRVVSHSLTALHLYGLGAGVALAGIAAALRRGPLLVALPLLLSAACAYSHFGITAEMAEVRGPAFAAEPAPEALARFSALHARATRIYGVVGLAALALVPLHVRRELRCEEGTAPAST